MPDFANPTGETLSLAARERLLDLAAELDIPVIEDAAYAALRFEGEPLPPILALDVARRGSIERARTIYCGTFSKMLSPGLRVGWIVAPRPLIRRLVLIKQASDLNSATINQMVMHRLAETVYDDQVDGGARSTIAAAATPCWPRCERHMPEGVRWTRPEGGLFVWLRLPEGLDSAAPARARRRARPASPSCRGPPSSSTAAAATLCASATRWPRRPRSSTASPGWRS